MRPEERCARLAICEPQVAHSLGCCSLSDLQPGLPAKIELFVGELLDDQPPPPTCVPDPKKTVAHHDAAKVGLVASADPFGALVVPSKDAGPHV